jgi:hypothetical protein
MKVVLAAAGGLALTLGAVGCGSSPRPNVQPDRAGQPTWGDCRSFVTGNLDFVSDAHGAKTRTIAIARYRREGDHVVESPRRAHRNAQVLLVDDHNVIHQALELWHLKNGWVVPMVEKCGD